MEASTSDACIKEAAKVKTFALSATLPYEEFFRGYSSYSKVVRLVARILRWRHPVNKQLDHTCRPDLIGPKEYKNAEYFLFSLVQKCNFTDDFFELQSSGKPSSSCRFKNMDPQFDFEKNLIIAGDRLKLSDLPEYTKYPIILPNKDLLVELLILRVHQKNHHSPQDTTIAILRERPIQRLHLLESGEETISTRDFPDLTAPTECSQGGEDVATDDAPSCEVPSRRRTIKPPAWQKDYYMF